MMSSRWPRPMGMSASTAFKPVNIGSETLSLGMMPGAFTSARDLAQLSRLGPLSMACPMPSTTRPSSSLPTGTSTMAPVRLTVSPSKMSRSSPKMTTPTLSSSRFSAMPRRPHANTTISPACTFERPNTRAMPSPTEITLPVSAYCVVVAAEPSAEIRDSRYADSSSVCDAKDRD